MTINGKFPGPTISAQEDDRIVVKVINMTPYNTTIHWYVDIHIPTCPKYKCVEDETRLTKLVSIKCRHGIKQTLSCWYDGPSYITQCPIKNGQSFTYNFTVAQQKGTFFWHAHFSWLRATVYGPLIVYPKASIPYPFKKPFKEHTILLGNLYSYILIKSVSFTICCY